MNWGSASPATAAMRASVAALAASCAFLPALAAARSAACAAAAAALSSCARARASRAARGAAPPPSRPSSTVGGGNTTRPLSRGSSCGGRSLSRCLALPSAVLTMRSRCPLSALLMAERRSPSSASRSVHSVRAVAAASGRSADARRLVKRQVGLRVAGARDICAHSHKKGVRRNRLLVAAGGACASIVFNNQAVGRARRAALPLRSTRERQPPGGRTGPLPFDAPPRQHHPA